MGIAQSTDQSGEWHFHALNDDEFEQEQEQELVVPPENDLLRKLVSMNWPFTEKDMIDNLINEIPDSSKEQQLLEVRTILADVITRLNQIGGAGVYLLDVASNKNNLMVSEQYLPELCNLFASVSQAHVRACLRNEHNLWFLLIEDYFSDKPKYAVLMNNQVSQLLNKQQLQVLLDLFENVMSHVESSQDDQEAYELNIGSDSGIWLCQEQLPKLRALVAMFSNALRNEHDLWFSLIKDYFSDKAKYAVLASKQVGQLLNGKQLSLLLDLFRNALTSIENNSKEDKCECTLDVGMEKGIRLCKDHVPKLRELIARLANAQDTQG